MFDEMPVNALKQSNDVRPPIRPISDITSAIAASETNNYLLACKIRESLFSDFPEEVNQNPNCNDLSGLLTHVSELSNKTAGVLQDIASVLGVCF